MTKTEVTPETIVTKGEVISKIEIAYDHLLPLALNIAGAPAEAPLTWQASITPEAAPRRLVLYGLFPDLKSLMIKKEYWNHTVQPETDLSSTWRIELMEKTETGKQQTTSLVVDELGRVATEKLIYEGKSGVQPTATLDSEADPEHPRFAMAISMALDKAMQQLPSAQHAFLYEWDVKAEPKAKILRANKQALEPYLVNR